MTTSQPSDKPAGKTDPIRRRFFDPLELAETFSDVLFYISAAFSIAVLLVDKSAHKGYYDAVQILFVLSVLGAWVIGIATRLYFGPRAQARRYEDFISHAYSIPITDEMTTKYYSNEATEPVDRVALQTLENALHSKDIASRMARLERLRFALYVTLWLTVVLNRSTDLAIAGIVAQIVFSEQLLSRWLRVEWVRSEFERVYGDLFRLYQSKADRFRFQVLVIEILGRYEMIKAAGGVTLSSRMFAKRQSVLSADWERLKATVLGK